MIFKKGEIGVFKFPLIIWEQTEEFKRFLNEAEQKKRELIGIWKKNTEEIPMLALLSQE